MTVKLMSITGMMRTWTKQRGKMMYEDTENK